MYHFIMNRVASSGQVLKTWESIRPILDERNVPYMLHTPLTQEESINTVKKLSSPSYSADGPVHLVVIGGDGTLNTIIQGIDDFDSITLSLIPAGSGNDFARALGISSNPSRALRHLLDSPSERVIDFGESSYLSSQGSTKSNRFLISSGTGYDADICEEVNRSSAKTFLNRIHLGKIVYLFIALKKIFVFKNYIKQHECESVITMDDKTSIRMNNMFLTVAMNTPYQGGGTPFCPMADWTDGYLDICAVDSMTTPKLLLCILFIYLKKHFLFKQVRHFRCKEITIKSKGKRWLHTDGETMEETGEITIRCHQGLHFIR